MCRAGPGGHLPVFMGYFFLLDISSPLPSLPPSPLHTAAFLRFFALALYERKSCAITSRAPFRRVIAAAISVFFMVPPKHSR